MTILKKSKGYNSAIGIPIAKKIDGHHSTIHTYIQTQFQRNLTNQYQNTSPYGQNSSIKGQFEKKIKGL